MKKIRVKCGVIEGIFMGIPSLVISWGSGEVCVGLCWLRWGIVVEFTD
jgi:hypothetical protein